MSQTTQRPNAAEVGAALRDVLGDRLDDAAIDALARTATGPAPDVRVSATLECVGTELVVRVEDGETFHGRPCVGTAGAAGSVYTGDLARLYADTVSFVATVTMVYVAVYFFDAGNTLLGYFMGGAVSPVVGNGGGTGTWS